MLSILSADPIRAVYYTQNPSQMFRSAPPRQSLRQPNHQAKMPPTQYGLQYAICYEQIIQICEWRPKQDILFVIDELALLF